MPDVVNPFRAPIKRRDDGFVVRLGDDETAMVRRLLGEMRALLQADDDTSRALSRRLFPVAHPDDPEMEAEYQRLMRDELVTSRLTSIDQVDQALASGARLDDSAMMAFARSLNSLRLVLGVMLGIDDDEGSDDGVAAGLSGSAEHRLYGYLSWLLEHSVQALAGR